MADAYGLACHNRAVRKTAPAQGSAAATSTYVLVAAKVVRFTAPVRLQTAAGCPVLQTDQQNARAALSDGAQFMARNRGSATNFMTRA
ncbi:hypothetical protein [Metallibacterium scheffleri]|uniref:hypothetical protein n=1 Tax=Metallibacterium scheffleri TaxID=993689 RepID=UPI0010A09235|nr:hypothetical protein [Metallibacterium scheffleri]